MTLTVYSKPACPQCEQAKSFIKQKGMQYLEVILDVGQPKTNGVQYITRDALLQKFPTAKMMPQIEGPSGAIGGFSELKEFLI